MPTCRSTRSKRASLFSPQSLSVFYGQLFFAAFLCRFFLTGCRGARHTPPSMLGFRGVRRWALERCRANTVYCYGVRIPKDSPAFPHVKELCNGPKMGG
jgi:hypothetical protein